MITTVTSCNHCPFCALEAEYGDAATCKLFPNYDEPEVYGPVRESYVYSNPPPKFCPLRKDTITVTFKEKT